MKYQLVKTSQAKKAQTKVFFVCKQSLKVPELDSQTWSKVKGHFKADYKQVFFCASRSGKEAHLCFVGLGDKKDLSGERMRSCAAVAYNELAKNKSFSVHVYLDSLKFLRSSFTHYVQCLFESFVYKSYRLENFKEKKSKDPKMEISFVTSSPNPSLAKKLKETDTLMNYVNLNRTWADSPPNLMTPVELASNIQKQAKGIAKLKVSVLSKAEIKKEKMGGLLSVSAGGNKDPRFIIMKYQGDRASKKPICFVGKGITFDSGGLSLKPPKAMEEMKYDMCGASCVASSLLAIASLKLKVNAIAVIPTCENLTGPEASKPGDIITSRSGKTVEVLNTDAEGRLILMDALSYACDKIKPRWIVDVATLTGAVIVCLSNVYTGAFTKNQALWDKLNKASKASGEKVWRLPLSEEFSKDMKGFFSDIQNISSYPGGGSSTAAAFLEYFVDPNTPWMHLDIAGTAWNTGNRLNYLNKKGASGVMMRTFVEMAKMS